MIGTNAPHVLGRALRVVLRTALTVESNSNGRKDNMTKTYRITAEDAAHRIKRMVDECDMDTLAHLFGEAFGYDTWTDQDSCNHLLCSVTDMSCDELTDAEEWELK